MFSLCAVPFLTFAQVADYAPLAPIPQLTTSGNKVNINSFVPGAIKLGIGIAGALAVIFLMYGGVQYITTDSVANMGNAKDTIYNAIFGLLLAISSYAILYTINPKLVEFDFKLQNTGPADALSDRGTGRGPIIGGEATSTTEFTPFTNVGCTNNCVAVSKSTTGINTKDSLNCGTNPCYLNSNLINKLQGVNSAMGGAGWQITEVFPPRVAHISTCHNGGPLAGTCADVALTTDSSYQKMDMFLDAIKAQGLSVGYETSVQADYAKWIKEPMLKEHWSNFKYNASSTGIHAHVVLR